MLGVIWRKTPQEEKRPFVEQEMFEREVYKQKMDAWKMEKEMKDIAVEQKRKDDLEAAASANRENAAKIEEDEEFISANGEREPPSWEDATRSPDDPSPHNPQAHPAKDARASEAWWNDMAGEPSELSRDHDQPHHHSYQQNYHQQQYHHQQGQHHPDESRSATGYSPIQLYHGTAAETFFCPSPGPRLTDAFHHPEGVTSQNWPIQPQSQQHQYHNYRTPTRSPMNTIMATAAASQESEYFDQQHQRLKRESEHDCSPVGSYDEFDQSLYDPVPIH